MKSGGLEMNDISGYPERMWQANVAIGKSTLLTNRTSWKMWYIPKSLKSNGVPAYSSLKHAWSPNLLGNPGRGFSRSSTTVVGLGPQWSRLVMFEDRNALHQVGQDFLDSNAFLDR